MANSYFKVGYVSDSALPDMTREDLQKLTHINVAFGHVREDEIVTGHLKQVEAIHAIKRERPELKVILSVGGWSAGGFSEAASTEEGRQRMAASAARVVRTLPFDGIDLDWEYPCYGEAEIASSPADKQNFTLLLAAIREALDTQGAADGRYYMLTIAAGADQYYVDGTEMDKAQQYLDYVQLMTYDMRGGFQVLTGHHSNLYAPTGDLFRISTDASVRLFVNAGVPKHKLVIGAAFYSRQWNGVPNRNQGLHQMAASTGGYGPSFTDLDAEYIDKNGFVRYWDNEACAPYLFNGSSFISYEDEQSIRCKCEYVMNEGLAGVMFWEYSCDRTHRLLDAIHQGLVK
ncbi:glycoside hydrolase family 18 protein [Paenibacillus lycopersici]|uniref:chitinase n=1 Tax=Paenibacillus lycopersici TaxID=2704462 RepID=A0A6C0G7E8_9BACL|nr:glycoside hydrolase family 18 protein [Paenibacillus lycopersici]QHT63670.1 glycoside hydrolase family 18 protein [Paenibacillus lycopersici]